MVGKALLLMENLMKKVILSPLVSFALLTACGQSDSPAPDTFQKIEEGFGRIERQSQQLMQEIHQEPKAIPKERIPQKVEQPREQPRQFRETPTRQRVPEKRTVPERQTVPEEKTYEYKNAKESQKLNQSCQQYGFTVREGCEEPCYPVRKCCAPPPSLPKKNEVVEEVKKVEGCETYQRQPAQSCRTDSCKFLNRYQRYN